MTTETINPVDAAVTAMAEAIASKIFAEIESTLADKVESAVEKYIDSSDFMYTLEDKIKDSIESMVEDYVSGISLSVRID